MIQKFITQCGYSKTQGVGLENIFSISKKDNNTFVMYEECDGYYSRELTKKEILKLFNQCIDWVNK